MIHNVSRRPVAKLVHSCYNDIMLDRRKVSGEGYIVIQIGL